MHLKILFFHPFPRRYPKAKDRAWLMREAEIDRQEVFWLKNRLKNFPWPNNHKRKLEILGKTTPTLQKLGHITKAFLEHVECKATVAIGTGQKPRFERFPRRRIVLGEPSLLQALHEISHSRFGPSEAIAVGWSCKMFTEIFPKAKKHGKWCKHELINEDEFL